MARPKREIVDWLVGEMMVDDGRSVATLRAPLECRLGRTLTTGEFEGYVRSARRVMDQDPARALTLFAARQELQAEEPAPAPTPRIPLVPPPALTPREESTAAAPPASEVEQVLRDEVASLRAVYEDSDRVRVVEDGESWLLIVTVPGLTRRDAFRAAAAVSLSLAGVPGEDA